MSEGAENTIQEPTEPTQVQEEVVDSVDSPVETDEPQEATSEDLVSEAVKINEQLKAELEALKNNDSNIFEQNEALKKELEEARKSALLAKENKELQAQLEAIKKNSLIDGMIAEGKINNDLREWADGLSYDQLQAFSKKAPKVRTILETKNKVAMEPQLEILEWQKQQQRSRIL